jgi:hypothetical protein
MRFDLKVRLRHMTCIGEQHGFSGAAHKKQVIFGYPDDFRHEQTSDVA